MTSQACVKPAFQGQGSLPINNHYAALLACSIMEEHKASARQLTDKKALCNVSLQAGSRAHLRLVLRLFVSATDTSSSSASESSAARRAADLEGVALRALRRGDCSSDTASSVVQRKE